MRNRLSLLAVTGALCASCSFHARGPEQYRDETLALLSGRDGGLRSCYDGLLQSDAGAKGTVVVRFTVKQETGAVEAVTVDAGRTTAPESVRACVVKSLEGLALAPPDARDGDATITWEFQIAPQAS